MMKKSLPYIFEDLRQALLGRKAPLTPEEDTPSPQATGWGARAGEAYSATVAGLKGMGGDTLSKTAQHFNDALPYIERAGYDVTEIEVGLGLSPKVVPHLRIRELISPEAQAALLVETSNKKLVNTILSSLFKASAAHAKLKFNKFHFSDMELELSILPSVVLKFRPNQRLVVTAPAETGTDGEAKK